MWVENPPLMPEKRILGVPGPGWHCVRCPVLESARPYPDTPAAGKLLIVHVNSSRIQCTIMVDVERQMADPTIIEIVRQYLRNLAKQGILARMGVIFGSHASGHPGQWSDIDLLVVSATFDGMFPRDAIDSLWRVAARTDSRIEPIPCGEHQWTEDHATPIIEIARREGVQVTPHEDADNSQA